MINCIQQIGLGVADIQSAFKWMRKTFGMDVPIFDDEGQPVHMTKYTGGKLQSRHAILAANLSGGSAFEIWQYTSRKPKGPGFAVLLGDLGIFAAKIKAADPGLAFKTFKKKQVELIGCIRKDPAGNKLFSVKDPFGNIHQIIGDEHWFSRKPNVTGGVAGCIVGVSDIDRSLELYSGILGYDSVVYDEIGVFDDFGSLPGGKDEFRRLLLKPGSGPKGLFSRLVGPSQIELVQAISRPGRKIFEDRFWGDLGFIHLCFDVHGMDGLREECERGGYPIKADSREAFDMGEASGRFTYIEDYDGTLIEFVETRKIPLIKWLGWYIDLSKRDPEKPLPDWMLRALSLSRVKD
jgi:catechol 2,3-dioxygenase-like lactoylglutathione lyase family enzyme